MENKNINSGQITTNSGNIEIGDKYTHVVIEGLGYLITEYRGQLSNIEKLIDEFKVSTALSLLSELENRISEINVDEKLTVLSKIIYLKAICKREIDNDSRQSATDFIKAYKLNTSDEKMRDRACVEYLNVDDRNKALQLADEILKVNEYNTTAWYVKMVCAEDVKAFISQIPKVLIEEYNFRLALVYHIIHFVKLNSLENLDEYSLSLEVEFERYKKVNFTSLEAWRIALDLATNEAFNGSPERYISGDEFLFADNAQITPVFDMHAKFVASLEGTELTKSISHQKFFYGYFGYLLTNDKKYFEVVESTFKNLDHPHWLYTFSYCQILNHMREYKMSFEMVLLYRKQDGEITSEVLLFEAALYHLTAQADKIFEVFENYLASIEVVDEQNGFNIISAFLNILHKKVDKSIIEDQLKILLNKNFKNDQIKTLLEIVVRVRYINDFDKEKTHAALIALKSFAGFDINWKNLLVENLNAIGYRKEAVAFLSEYIDKAKVSESLRFYIFLLHEQLLDKNDEEKGKSKELLDLLKFWRLNSKYPDREMLLFEHNLNAELNDLESLRAIDSFLYEKYPSNEQYTLLYLNVLERLRDIEEIKRIAVNIPEDVQDESFGVRISIILLRTGTDIDKGFKIIYKLASNPNNTIARRNYFGLTFMVQELFKNFPAVSKGNWVSYKSDGKIEYVKIEKDSGLQKELLNKKPGDTFTIATQLSQRIIEIEVLEVMNDALHLLREINIEMENPANELGFESIKMPTDGAELIDFLKKTFGEIGSKEKDFKQNRLDEYFNYRIGFTEVTRAVFRENYLDSYLTLTSSVGNTFTTLPSIITKRLLIKDEIEFALDFSTLLLFYFLEQNLEFHFIHKFKISFWIKNEIESELVEIKNTPFSPMSVQITNQFVRRYDTPQDFTEKREQFLNGLLEWIDDHCIIDLVEEKLDLLPKFHGKEMMEDFMKILVDYMCLSDRDNCQVISSDSTLFLFTNRNNTFGNIINPEKYLLAFYPQKCDATFYRFLLQSNYLGISIPSDVLRSEFFQMLAGGQNFYHRCLENLQFYVHTNSQVVEIVSKFLKEMYLIPSLTIEMKNRYAGEVLSKVFVGMPKDLKIILSKKIQLEFRLMGQLIDEIRTVFLTFSK